MKHTTLVCVVLIFCGALNDAEARWTSRPRRTTTAIPSTEAASTTTTTTLIPDISESSVAASDVTAEDQDEAKYHPAEVKKPRLIERTDQRYADGHYEFRYVLSNGDTRYERSYWQQDGKKNILARKGFYSYPLPNQKYLTVFYTADQNGFHQESATYSEAQPVLPRSLDAIDMVVPIATEKPFVVLKPKPKPQTQKKNIVVDDLEELTDDSTEYITESAV